MFFNINSGRIITMAKTEIEKRRSKYHFSDKRSPLFTLNALATRMIQNHLYCVAICIAGHLEISVLKTVLQADVINMLQINLEIII